LKRANPETDGFLGAAIKDAALKKKTHHSELPSGNLT
jgi:hypothetical protein